MKKMNTRIFIPILLLLAMICLMASVVVAQEESTPEAPVEAESTAEPVTQSDLTDFSILNNEVNVAIEPTGDNGYCTICHDQPLRTVQLGDGSILNLYVNPAMIAGSVHGPSEDGTGLGCLDCHGENAFPHVGPPPADGRIYTLESVSLCASCHVEQHEELLSGLHAQAISEGNLEAAVCTDCHGAHHVQSAEGFPQLVAGVCGDCHENTLVEWQTSPHNNIGPLGCATCHDYHAQTLRAGETPSDLCLTCHSEMDPTFTHDVHVEIENPVACETCHMHGLDEIESTTVSTLDLPDTGHSMLVSTVPCSTCHSDLVESGEWQTIINERYGVSGDATLTTDAGTEDEERNDEDGGSLLTLQGLLVGLGLGVTFAVVFITRSARRRDAA